VGFRSGCVWRFAHDEKIIEPAQEEIAVFGGGAIVAHVEGFVVANDGDDVDRFELLAQQGEQFKADGVEGFAFHK
jgi:hypothetical protein